MLTKRLIATILLKDGLIVQSKQFKHTNVIGNARTAIDFFNTWSVDEIIILDVSPENNRGEFLNIIEDFSSKCFVPLAVGGYNRTKQDIRDCLNVGADKIVINRIAFEHADRIPEFAETFGSQCIVFSMDCKDGKINVPHGTSVHPVEWAKKAEEFKVGEIYLTSIDRDGMGCGYDLETIKEVSSAVNIPVIASGGCGSWQHIVEAFQAGADAVSVANKFHYSEHSVKEAKEYLLKAGIKVRPPEFCEV